MTFWESSDVSWLRASFCTTNHLCLHRYLTPTCKSTVIFSSFPFVPDVRGQLFTLDQKQIHKAVERQQSLTVHKGGGGHPIPSCQLMSVIDPKKILWPRWSPVDDPGEKDKKRQIVAGAFLFLAPLIFVPSLCGQRVASAVICMLHCLIVMLPFTSFHCWLICQLLFGLIVCSIKSQNSENHNLSTVTSCFQPTLPKGCLDYYHRRQRSDKKW